jgi:hypothetical protein
MRSASGCYENVNDAWTVGLALASLFVLTCGVLALAWHRGRLGVASAVVMGLAVVAWVAVFAAVTSGYHDADGFADCGDGCTPAHRFAALWFVGAPLLISLSAAGLLVALVARGRRRRREA